MTVRGDTNVAAQLIILSTWPTLAISGSTEAGDAKLTLLNQDTPNSCAIAGDVEGSARVVLTTTDANASATVDVAGGTLVNCGRILVEPGAGALGGRYWHGALAQARGSSGLMFVNEDLTILGAEPWLAGNAILLASGKTLRVDAGLVVHVHLRGPGAVQGDVTNRRGGVAVMPGTLTISGNYAETRKGGLTTVIAGPGAGEFGVLDVAGTAELAGGLGVDQRFGASLGQTFPILRAASRQGTFARVSGGAVPSSNGLYFSPTYSPTSVTLEVKQATLSIAPSEGPAGTSVTVTGSGWFPGDAVALLFVDSARQKSRSRPLSTAQATSRPRSPSHSLPRQERQGSVQAAR